MAWLRIESRYTGSGAQFDGLCETATDMAEAENNGVVEAFKKAYRFGKGSLCYCTATNKIYVMGSNGTWTEVG